MGQPKPGWKHCPRCGKIIGDDVVAHSDCTPDEPQPDPRLPANPGTSADLAMWAEHWDVLTEAHDIHIDRTAERGEQWLDEGRDKMMSCAKDKVYRLEHAVNHERPFNEDDALDAINYLAFAIQCNRRGRIERDYDEEPDDEKWIDESDG
jgi:hypothetical protein